MLNTRLNQCTVTILKKAELDFMHHHYFYGSMNICYLSQKDYILQKTRKSRFFVHVHVTLCFCNHIQRRIPFLNSPRNFQAIYDSFTERRKVLIFPAASENSKSERDLHSTDRRGTYQRAHNRSNSYCSTQPPV